MTGYRIGLVLIVALIGMADGPIARAADSAWSVCTADSADFDKTIAACSEFLQLGPRETAQKRSTAYQKRGVAYGRKSDYERTIADQTEALRLNPKNARAYFSRGLSYANRGDNDRAIADYTEALRLDPNASDYLLYRGTIYSKQRSYDLAITDFSKALRITPTDAVAQLARGKAYSGKGDYAKAIADYTAWLLKISPGDTNVLLARGKAYAAVNNFDPAVADYNEALRINPGLEEARSQLQQAKTAQLASLNRPLNNGAAAKQIPPQEFSGELVPHVVLPSGQPPLNAAPVQQSATALPQPTMPTPAPSPATPAAASAPAAVVAAAPPGPPVANPAPPAIAAKPAPLSAPDRRVALVIGNAAYRNVPVLANPPRDAQTIADALRKTGFQTVKLQADLGREALINALREFAQLADKADWAVVYYAGHGIEVGGVNYLIPVDAKLSSDRDVGFEAVALDQVINAAERAGKLRLIVLDACRDNPFANQMKRSLTVASRSVSRGLAQVEPDAGTLVVYAAKHGETALDGEGGSGNSPFAAAFVKNMQQPGIEVRRLFDNVRDDVMETTRRRQQPFSYGSISGRQDFYFVAAR